MVAITMKVKLDIARAVIDEDISIRILISITAMFMPTKCFNCVFQYFNKTLSDEDYHHQLGHLGDREPTCSMLQN